MKARTMLILLVLLMASVSVMTGCDDKKRRPSSKPSRFCIRGAKRSHERISGQRVCREDGDRSWFEGRSHICAVGPVLGTKDIMLAANEPIDLYWDGLPDLSTIVNKKQAMVLDDLIEEYGQDMLKVLPMERLQGQRSTGRYTAFHPLMHRPPPCTSWWPFVRISSKR